MKEMKATHSRTEVKVKNGLKLNTTYADLWVDWGNQPRLPQRKGGFDTNSPTLPGKTRVHLHVIVGLLLFVRRRGLPSPSLHDEDTLFAMKRNGALDLFQDGPELGEQGVSVRDDHGMLLIEDDDVPLVVDIGNGQKRLADLGTLEQDPAHSPVLSRALYLGLPFIGDDLPPGPT